MVQPLGYQRTRTDSELERAAIEHNHAAMTFFRRMTAPDSIVRWMLVVFCLGGGSGCRAQPLLQAVDVVYDEPTVRYSRYRLNVFEHHVQVEHRLRRQNCPQSWEAKCWEISRQDRKISEQGAKAALHLLKGLPTQPRPLIAAPGVQVYSVVLERADASTRYASVVETDGAQALALSKYLQLLDAL